MGDKMTWLGRKQTEGQWDAQVPLEDVVVPAAEASRRNGKERPRWGLTKGNKSITCMAHVKPV